ncbi:MAG TPA: GNAT family protein [Vicinamibacterales bacterium]|nr:GNAT family protein [Vicinamibacterales bacterium]
MAVEYGHFIEGERIYLREVQLSDVTDRYYQWINDAEVNQYLETRFRPTTMESLREFVAAKLVDRDNVFLALIVKDGDRHIGNIKLGPINWVHRFADVALMLGDKEHWGKGYGSEAIALVTDYGLNRLNLHKLTASCYASNQGSAKAFIKAGWEQEAVRKRQFYFNGSYEDSVHLATWRRD